MGDRPFFRLSADGPGLQASTTSVIIVPVVSAGNVSQLCADLLIHTLALRQIGIFDPSYYVPAVGGKDGQTTSSISTPMELFGLPGGDVFVLQQRSPVLKDRKADFVPRLLDALQTNGFGSILFLVGSDQSTRTDAQMGSIHYHILGKDTTRDLVTSSPLANLLELPSLGQSLEAKETEENSIIPGAGLARRLLIAPGPIPRIALVQYVAEGDNVPDAHAMANEVAKSLKIEIKGWKQPASWNFAMYGTPHDQQLFGVHEEVEGKLLKLYKRHTTALESDIALHKVVFNARSVALKDRANSIATLDGLRTWYAEARSQWVLATRALDTRVRHHNAFYGGGDAGHLQYLDFLRTLISELEDFMQKCDELGYELLLQKECAKWVQNAPPPSNTSSAGCGMETAAASRLDVPDTGSGPCPEPNRAPDEGQALLTPPPSPSSRRRKSKAKSKSQQPTQEDVAGCQSAHCPDDTACRDSQKREAVVHRLCAFLEPELGSASYRGEVFATFFRRAIARSPSLFVRVRTWEHESNKTTSQVMHQTDHLQPSGACVVAEFIRSNALSQSELERLVKKLPFVRGESMSAELVRGAVADTFRPGRTTNENCIPLLGGWVFEKTWAQPMPVVAWDAMHQLVACAGCALGVSRSFEEALQVRRSAFVGGCHEDALRLGVPVPAYLPDGAVPRFPRWQDQCSPPEIAMRILNVWLVADNRKTKRSELKKFTPKAHGMKATYSEHEERHWMYMRMRWSDSRLLSFISSLDASDKYTVLAQRNTKPNSTQVHVPDKESDAWVSRVRSGATPVARRSARWTTSTVFRMEIFEYFHNRSPEAKAGLTYLDETNILDVVVMDNDNGDWTPFLQSVGDFLLSACGYSSLDAMLTGELVTAKPSV